MNVRQEVARCPRYRRHGDPTTSATSPRSKPRHLVLALGDQLNLDSAAFDGFDPPFTPSFLRRNEVMVRVQEDAVER